MVTLEDGIPRPTFPRFDVLYLLRRPRLFLTRDDLTQHALPDLLSSDIWKAGTHCDEHEDEQAMTLSKTDTHCPN
jgi:hypothetical protein